MADTPPYANDTLRWVALEVRFPLWQELSAPGPSSATADALRATFPVREQQNEVALTFGASGPAQQQTIRHRFLKRDRLMMSTIGRDSITLETTSYPGWSAFRDQFVDVLQAVSIERPPDGVLRLGLRYIDEIRVPAEIESLGDWDGWLAPALLTPFAMLERAPTSAQIALQYGEEPGLVTMFRALPFAEGRTVQSDGPLRMPMETESGPYFLLDTDSSWVDPQRQVPEFELATVVDILDQLHEPCISLYEASIGPRLRSEVLEPAESERGPSA